MNKPEHLPTNECPTGVMAVAFLAGAILGAGAVLLLTPEPGSAMRQRLLRGAKVAKDELTDIVSETRDALEALGKDARQTAKRTTSRLKTATAAAMDALTTDSDGDTTPTKERR